MAFELVLYRRRSLNAVVTVTDADDEEVLFTAGDVFRLKIGRAGAAPILDLESVAASANGSTVEAANPSDVLFDQDDTALLAPGTYDAEAAIYESGDGLLRAATPGVVHVVDTQLGDVGAS